VADRRDGRSDLGQRKEGGPGRREGAREVSGWVMVAKQGEREVGREGETYFPL